MLGDTVLSEILVTVKFGKPATPRSISLEIMFTDMVIEPESATSQAMKPVVPAWCERFRFTRMRAVLTEPAVQLIVSPLVLLIL